jgi:biopolymer transport protein ExbD
MALLSSNSGKRKRVLSLTSLIDVIFLLLLFFMLSSTFSNYTDLDLAASSPGASTSKQTPVLLKLTHDTLAINGKNTSLTELATDIAPFAQESAKRLVLVSLGPQVNAQQLVDLMVVMAKQKQFNLLVLE